MKNRTENSQDKKLKNKKITIPIIFLTFLISILLIFSQIPKTNAQGQINSATYQYENIQGTNINMTIKANVGVLEDGGISVWGFFIDATTNDTVDYVIIRGATNGSIFNRGLTFPATGIFNQDTALYPLPFTSKEFTGMMLENLLLLPDIYGIPNFFTFNLSIFIKTATNNQTLDVSSGNKPLISFIFQNPESTPDIGTMLFTILYALPFILPICIVIVNIIFKKLEKKRELKKLKRRSANEG